MVKREGCASFISPSALGICHNPSTHLSTWFQSLFLNKDELPGPNTVCSFFIGQIKAFTFQVLKKKKYPRKKKKKSPLFLVQTSKKPQDFMKQGECHKGSIRSTLQGPQLDISSQQNTGRKPQPSDTLVLLTHSIHGCNKYRAVLCSRIISK